MSEHDDTLEIAAPPVAVQETHRLSCLTPTVEGLSRAARQIALVPANTEGEARRIATTADPMGLNWSDLSLFVADCIETGEQHAVGEVVFQSIPNPIAAKKRFGKA